MAEHQQKTKTWRWFHTVGIVLIVVAITAVGWLSPVYFRLGAWLINLVLLAFLIILAGHGITGLVRGCLISENLKLSLSRLQLVLWTVVILSAFFTAALGNLAQKEANPLSISIPAEIWLVLGISFTSLVGSPLILSNKKKKIPNYDEMKHTIRTLSEQKGVELSVLNPVQERAMDNPRREDEGVEIQGQLIKNLRPEDAEVGDLFRGEETGNAALLDIGKIQLFLLTLLIVLVYSAALGSRFFVDRVINDFPALDESTLALLGISHAAYLTNKAIPHSETGAPREKKRYLALSESTLARRGISQGTYPTQKTIPCDETEAPTTKHQEEEEGIPSEAPAPPPTWYSGG